MNRRSVKHTLTMTCLMLVLLASLLLGATSIFSIRNTTNMALTEYESAMDSGYNTEIKSEVQTVIAVLQAEYDKSQAGELTEEEAKAEAKEIVRAMRYRDDGSGYFWIDDTDYNLVTVSYTHLDVYKRQRISAAVIKQIFFLGITF